MQSVYIETTIPSFYYETRADPTIVAWRRSTQRWWRYHRATYHLVTSEFVLAEVRQTPSPKAERMASRLAAVDVLPVPDRLDEIIAAYIEHRLMPADSRGDAAHLAFASLAGINFLLTWNCRHLANMNKVRHLTVLNRRLGLAVPVLATPDTLIPESPA